MSAQNLNDETKDVDRIFESKRMHERVDSKVDPHKLHEMVVEELLKGRVLSKLSRGEQKVLEFLVDIEYQHDIDRHVQKYKQRFHLQTDSEARNELLQEKIGEYEGWDDGWSDDEVSVFLPEVDRPVQSGQLTSLHLAAAEGSLDDVRRLVEECGASVKVRDSYGLTPLERAEMMGQVKVIEYLNQVKNKAD